MKKKFGALRLIATVFLIIAVLWVIFTLFWFFGSLIVGLFLSEQTGITFLSALPLALFGAFMGVLNAVAMFALSETIKLFVDIEEHTRETRRLMEKLEENTHATAVILHHRQSKSE